MRRFRENIAFKSIAGIVALLVLFTAIVLVIGYQGFTDYLLAQYADGAFSTADIAALNLDPYRLDAYLRMGGATAEYRAAWRKLDSICNSSGSTFVYVIQPDTSDYAHITFLFSTINHDSEYTLYDFGYVRETTNDDYRRKYRALYEGESDREIVVRDKGYIETDPHITAMIPLRTEEGVTKGILCVQRQMDVLIKARNGYLDTVLKTLAVLLVLVVCLMIVYLQRKVLHPVRRITEEAARFAQENVKRDRLLTDEIRTGDEIERLAGSIDRMEEQIQEYVEHLTEITAERERIGTELELANRIQADMLPSTFPPFPDRNEFDIFATMDPAKEVGGDFYDFFLIDEDHLGLVMADVSGKGVPAALFMMATKILIANTAMLGISPKQILERTNNIICANNREEMFITVWIGVLELSTGRLTAANAGHEYPVIRRDGGLFEVFKDRHGFVLGGMEGAKYREYELTLRPGDKLFLYTDGAPEATDARQELFGMERLVAALNEDAEADPRGVLGNVRRAVDRFVGDAPQFDDLTMMCVEYYGPMNAGA